MLVIPGDFDQTFPMAQQLLADRRGLIVGSCVLRARSNLRPPIYTESSRPVVGLRPSPNAWHLAARMLRARRDRECQRFTKASSPGVARTKHCPSPLGARERQRFAKAMAARRRAHVRDPILVPPMILSFLWRALNCLASALRRHIQRIGISRRQRVDGATDFVVAVAAKSTSTVVCNATTNEAGRHPRHKGFLVGSSTHAGNCTNSRSTPARFTSCLDSLAV